MFTLFMRYLHLPIRQLIADAPRSMPSAAPCVTHRVSKPANPIRPPCTMAAPAICSTRFASTILNFGALPDDQKQDLLNFPRSL
jgi:hypothetical protein